MAFSKIKLCWGTARIDAEWRLGLFGVYQRTKGGRLQGLAISVRGLMTWLGVLAVVGYFSAAGALYWWFQRKPHNQITYTALVLPTRWSSLKSLRGQALIAQGMDDIKARRWSEGLARLRRGVDLHPADTEGRIVLADLFIAMRARQQAVEVYDGALERGYPGRAYMEALLRTAGQAEDYDWWLRACDRALQLVAGRPELADDRSWLVQRKLEALIASDRAGDALKLTDEEGGTGGSALKEFRVLALLKAGRAADAVGFLSAWAKAAGGRPDPQVLRLQARAYREAGDVDGMRRCLEAFRQITPASPRPYVYAVVQMWRAGLRADAEREIDRFLLRFGSRPDDVLLLASAMTEIGEPFATRRLLDHAREHGFETGAFLRAHVNTLVASGAWETAAAVLAENPPAARATPAERGWYDLVQARVGAALDPADGAQSQLVTLVRGRAFTPKFFKELIAGLRASGRVDTARQIVTFAQGLYPTHPLIETWRKELDAQLAAVQATKPEFKLTRAPASEAVAAADIPARKIISKEAYRAGVDERVRVGDFAAALSWLREVRLTKPEWWAASEGELALEEIRLAGRAGDLLGVRTLVRFYNSGARQRTVNLIVVAREFHDAGRAEEAVFVIREVLSKSPENPAAKKLLGEWMPASDAGEAP